MSRTTLILDSTQIAAFLECPQRHDYEFEQSLVQINHTCPDLTFQVPDKIAAGSLGHKYLEIYYTVLGRTRDPIEATKIAMDFDPDKADTIDKEFPLDPKLRQKVRDRFVDYIMKYGRNDYEVGITTKTRIGLKDGQLADLPIRVPLVERGFSFLLYDSSEYLFLLEGRIDFIGNCAGEALWMDHKWQLRERQLYAKSIQFRNYALATGFPLGIINYVRLHDKLSEKTLVRQPISFSPGERRAWHQELIEIYIKIAKAKRDGVPERNRSACSGKYGYPCSYTPICELYTETQRDAEIRQNFTKKKEWKPW